MRFAWLLAAFAAVSAMSGCKSSYAWRSQVPESKRTVSVPVFRNESDVTAFGSVAARQVLREFQREGTFKIRTNGDAALEVQGIVRNVSASTSGYDRRGGLRMSSYRAGAEIAISVIDKVSGKVLVDNRVFTAQASFASKEDFSTSLRDVSGRLAEDLARQVVDAVVSLKW